jgi:uncharacterized membrane protein (DUF106 family)
MARTAEKVEALTEESGGMADALGTVLDVAEENGVVTWSDVSEDLTSGQWGRLIEKGLLVDADGAGFVLDDPEGIREAIDGSTAPEIDDEEGSNWTTYDKAAAGGAIAMFAGYSIQSVRGAIGSTIDIFLGPLEAAMPFYVVILILALVTGLYSTILQDKLMNTELMGKYQARMQELQDRREAAKERGDDEELDRIQEEQMDAMGDQLGMMKAQFRPMVWIMLLTIPAFLWMYWLILDVELGAEASRVMVMPLLGEIETWQQGVIGPLQAWILWYFLCSLGFSQVMRKAMNVQATPTGS